MKKLDISKVIENNPTIDLDQVRESLRQIEELRELGIVSNKGYRLDPPYVSGYGSYTPLPDNFQLSRSFAIGKNS